MCRAPGSRRKGAALVFNTDRASEACESNLPHTGQLHGPCKRESGSAPVSCTDRVRGFGSARVFSTGRVRKACALIFRVARGVLINTDRVRYLACTGLGWLCTGRVRDFWFCTGRVLGSARGVHFGTGHLFCTGHSRFCTGPASFARVV